MFGRGFAFSRRNGILSYLRKRGDEAIFLACAFSGQVEADSKKKYSRTPLSWAAGDGREMVVQLLLSTGQVEIDAKDWWFGRTALSWAAANGRETVVQLLLNTSQVEVDAKDKEGRTPLSWAAWNGREAVVQLLLNTGQVEIDAKDNLGWTPLSKAARNGREAVVRLLQQAFAGNTRTASSGCTAPPDPVVV